MKELHQVFSRQIFPFLQVFLLLILFLPFNLVSQNILSDHIIISFSVFIVACLAAISIFMVTINKQILQVTITDILAAYYFVYILLNAYVIRPIPVPDILEIRYLLVVLIYLSVRIMTNKEKNRGLTIIMVIGILEAIFIMLQACGLLESRHLLFKFTGSFFNPGLAGCFIACSLCILIYYLVTALQPLNKLFISAGTILLSCALILTNSRAGWLAAIIGISYILWHSDNKLIRQVKLHLRNSFIPKIIIISIILSGMMFFYQYKKSSADGRLFIWKVCLEMIEDKPLTGHGPGTFRSKFPHYQAAFFTKKPNSDYAFVAGNPSTPFNEYLSVLVTQGLVGFTLLIIILLTLFMNRDITRKQKMKQAFLLTFCIFAFFSYPMEHYRTLILFPFFTALLPSKYIVTIHNQKINFILFSIVFSGMYFSVKAINEFSKLEQTYKLQHRMTTVEYEKIKYDIDLLENYYTFVGYKLPDAEELKIVEDYVNLYPSSIGLCELGKKYKVKNNPNKAREYFTFASNINPSLITPYYELFLVYQEEGNINEMKEIGKKILHHKIKEESTTSLKMKAYVKKILHNLQAPKKVLINKKN